jgi:hypothetical protein
VDPVGHLQACARAVAVASARLLAAIVAVADRAKSGFDADEIAFALAWTQSAARSQVELGRYLMRTLPGVFAALDSGDIDLRRAWVFSDVLGAVDDAIAINIAATVLPRAGELTTSQLRDRLRRAVLKADPDASKRTARSEADRYVACQPDSNGTASVFGVCLPAARAAAAFERVDAYARGRKLDGDERTLDQLRADTFLDLLEGVGMVTPPIHRAGVIELTVPWTTAVGAANDPGLLAGHGPIGADAARAIITRHLTAARGATTRESGGVRWRHTMTADDGTLVLTTAVRAPRTARAAAAHRDRSEPPLTGSGADPLDQDARRDVSGPRLSSGRSIRRHRPHRRPRGRRVDQPRQPRRAVPAPSPPQARGWLADRTAGAGLARLDLAVWPHLSTRARSSVGPVRRPWTRR